MILDKKQYVMLEAMCYPNITLDSPFIIYSSEILNETVKHLMPNLPLFILHELV